MEEKKEYLFMAYKTEEDYANNPYMFKVFKDFDKMKTFSANHSFKEKKKYLDYCSTYFKFDKQDNG